MCARPVTPGGGQYALSEMTETGTETDVKAGILTDLTREREMLKSLEIKLFHRLEWIRKKKNF